MIQRLQTLFLILAGVINLFIFFTPLYRHAVRDPQGWIGTGFAIFLTGAMLFAVVSTFFYKNRKRQLVWVKAGTCFQIAALAVGTSILFTLGGFGTFLLTEALSLFFILIGLISYWQAGRFIKKDEELVRSMDRIR
ncbi:MAG: DUF4293 family protein [Balneolaceae bacterium]